MFIKVPDLLTDVPPVLRIRKYFFRIRIPKAGVRIRTRIIPKHFCGICIFFRTKKLSLTWTLSYSDWCMFKIKIIANTKFYVSRENWFVFLTFQNFFKSLIKNRKDPPDPDPQYWWRQCAYLGSDAASTNIRLNVEVLHVNWGETHS